MKRKFRFIPISNKDVLGSYDIPGIECFRSKQHQIREIGEMKRNLWFSRANHQGQLLWRPQINKPKLPYLLCVDQHGESSLVSRARCFTKISVTSLAHTYFSLDRAENGWKFVVLRPIKDLTLLEKHGHDLHPFWTEYMSSEQANGYIINTLLQIYSLIK